MLKGLAALIKELRETTDYLLALPAKLVLSFQDTLISHGSKKDRIRRQQNLVELREIGKSLISISINKGDLLSSIKLLQKDPEQCRRSGVKDKLKDICAALERTKNEIQESSLIADSVLVEAAFRLGGAIRYYRQLESLDVEEFCKLDSLVEAYACIEAMQVAGQNLVKAIDEERRILDNTYDP